MVTTTTPTKPIHADHPQPGWYKYRRHREAPWEPAFIKREADGKLVCRISNRNVNPEEVWTYLAGNRADAADVKFAFANAGKWPSDPPPVPVIELPKVEPGKPGHNSGDPAAFHEMCKDAHRNILAAGELLANSPLFARDRAALETDIGNAVAYYATNPIKTKTDADRCENWRSRIYKAADALDEFRKAEKATFDTIVKEIDQRYFSVIRPAVAYSKTLQGLADTWAREETARRQRAAEAEARKRVEEALAAAPPPAATSNGEDVQLPLEAPAPVVAPVEKVLLGTGPQRRSAKAGPASATIVDLVAVAKFYAEQQQPDLIALLQKLATKAAKANVVVPGCVMSWQTPKQEAAE